MGNINKLAIAELQQPKIEEVTVSAQNIYRYVPPANVPKGIYSVVNQQKAM